MEIVLSIAGSDPSAGAGIQQDLKTITHMGSYGATVITALTSQNTLGVQDVSAVAPSVVTSQLQSVLADLTVAAIKIGQIPNRAVAQAVVSVLQPYLRQHRVPVIYDPVMISTSGRALMEPDCIDYVCRELFPLCTLITPNIPETEALLGHSLSPADLDSAGRQLSSRYHCAFLLKGGHAEGSEMTDRLYCSDGTSHTFVTQRVHSTNLHGTGCTLSSAIATALAQGQSLPDAVATAKQLVTNAIKGGATLHIGGGNGPLWIQ